MSGLSRVFANFDSQFARLPEACAVLAVAVLSTIGGATSAGAASALSPSALSPSQVTPSTFEPRASPTGDAPDLPSIAPLAAPPGAQSLRFRVRHIVVDDDFPDLRDAAEALIRTLEGRRITVAQLFRVGNAVEKLYGDQGYALVRVTVPPQQVSEGSDAHLLVIDGYIESLSLTGVPERSRAAVAARVGPLVGKRRLKSTDLERAVLLAGDVVGVRLRSALARGASPGGVVLALNAEERLVSASVGTDNSLPASLGGWQSNARLSLNNPFGFGEQAYLSLASGYALGLNGFPMSPLRTLAAGALAPVGVDGCTINPEFTQSLTRPHPATGAPPSVGTFTRFAFRGSVPLQRTRDANLTLTAALEAIDQQLYGPLQNADFSHDRYEALRVGANWQGAAFWGAAIQADAQVSRGLGGRHASDAVPLSREGAGPDFTKLTGGFRLGQPLPGEFRLDLSARAQWAFRRPQLTSESFALDGADAVSAFTQGAFSVDAGQTARVELSRPVALGAALSPSWGAVTLSPYLFAAEGYGALYKTTAVEQSQIEAAAFGLGARLSWDAPDGFTAALLGLELARGVSNVPSQAAGYRAALNLSIKF